MELSLCFMGDFAPSSQPFCFFSLWPARPERCLFPWPGLYAIGDFAASSKLFFFFSFWPTRRGLSSPPDGGALLF